MALGNTRTFALAALQVDWPSSRGPASDLESIAACQGAPVHLAGARVVITSSSDEKLERAREPGADETINYEDTPEGHEAVLDVTGGRGADAIVEVGGTGTLGRSYQSVAEGGKIGLIGVLEDADEVPDPHALMGKGASLHGILVGGYDLFADMNASIEVNEIQPVIDRTFDFDDAPEENGVLETAGALGMAFVPYFPLKSGLLTGKYRKDDVPEGSRLNASSDSRFEGMGDDLLTPENLDVVEDLIAFAEARGRTILELAFSWLLSHDAVASVIAGATKPAQIRSNAQAAGWTLTDEERAEVDRITSGRQPA